MQRPGSDSIGLIDVPETETGGPARGVVPWVVMGLFFLVVVGTGLVDALAPLPPPRLVGREAAEEDALRENAQFLDGSWSRWIERDRRLRSRVRHWVQDPYALVLYRFLGEAGDRIIVGREGWLFLRDQVELPSLQRRDVGTIAQYGGALFAALDRAFALRDVTVIALPVPRKASVCRELLPPGWAVREEVDRLLVHAIQERGVQVVDLPSVYDGLDPRTLYYPEGTHWSEEGARLAAEETARVAGLLVPEAQRTTRLVPVPLDAERQDLTVLFNVGLGLDESRGPSLMRPLTGYDVVRADGSILGLQISRIEPVVVVGTSYSHSYQYSPFLEHYIAQPIGVYARPGHYTLSQLRAMLQSSDELPETLVFEEPNLDSFSTDPWPLLGEVLQLLPPAPSLELGAGPLEAVSAPEGADGFAVGAEAVPLLRIPPRRVFQTGDGLLALRVGAAVQGGGAVLEVVPHDRDEPRRSDFRVRALLSPERSEVLLPIVTPGAASPAVTLQATSFTGRTLRLAEPRVELVLLVDPATRVDARAGRPEVLAGGWSVRLELPPGTTAPEQGGFAAGLPADPAYARPFAVELHFDGDRAEDAPVAFPCLGLSGDGWVALDLDRHAGRTLAAVTLRGGGPPPASPPATAFLAGVAR